jgi:mannosyl-oligosaccharide glucosidase
MRLGALLGIAVASLAAEALAQPDLSDSETVARSSNESLLWGTYRPNLYFGLRPRLPATLLTGLMWFGAQDYQGFSSECESLGYLVASFAPLTFSLHRDETRL